MGDTELSLAQPEPWTIKKVLTPGDCGSQVLLPKGDMETYILPEMGNDARHWIANGGFAVSLKDASMNASYNMTLTQSNQGSYYFRGEWPNVVRAKGLKPGDVVGIWYCRHLCSFYLYVIEIA